MHFKGPLTGIAQDAERILRTLPLWFGVEESLQEYVRDTERLSTFGAIDNQKEFPLLWGPRLPVLQLVKVLQPAV